MVNAFVPIQQDQYMQFSSIRQLDFASYCPPLLQIKLHLFHLTVISPHR